MPLIEKACPIILRQQNHHVELLAFTHPLAGNQLVKGTIEVGEEPSAAAQRELNEESGLKLNARLHPIGSLPIGSDNHLWHFFAGHTSGLPQAWQHETLDDFGHTFSFFWHPLSNPLDQTWHRIFHEAVNFVLPHLFRITETNPLGAQLNRPALT
ncbi:DNA mismatch repair protein MutT [Pseudovibrio japonicus]|uniref:DNA mismatch repair protein MutT n=1 Tax=Pseudovibrio japonicus TaxID=366534 RepID=A0ABQ3EPS7_9HYPH|nr:NUDIX domain-containing protein [Pseudovibrio japonicus]GHB50464.1 DNA mismatch repair protein MutT [Pseudovibrio japonicus]